jgi:hypothetical protein
MTIYNPICYSLYTDDVRDDKCLKRRFIFYDIVKSEYLDIYVCAEYFRLLFDKHRDDYSWLNDAPSKAINEAISEYIPYFELFNEHKYYFGRNDNSFVNIRIPVLLIDRPKIWVGLEIHNAFKILLENPKECKQLRADIANSLLFWSSGKTMVKDSFYLKKVRDALGISHNRSENKKYNRNDVGYCSIDENELIDLIVILTNKLK